MEQIHIEERNTIGNRLFTAVSHDAALYGDKKRVPDCILFYRLGDFYEMFFDDALKASKELEITLTGKECGLKERAPMCGVPFHAVDSYLYRLVQKGYKVAIAEQMEDPKLAKGLVKRRGDPCGNAGNHYQCPGFGRDKK